MSAPESQPATGPLDRLRTLRVHGPSPGLHQIAADVEAVVATVDALARAVLAKHPVVQHWEPVGTDEIADWGEGQACYGCRDGLPLLATDTEAVDHGRGTHGGSVMVLHLHAPAPGSERCATCADPAGESDLGAPWPCPTVQTVVITWQPIEEQS